MSFTSVQKLRDASNTFKNYEKILDSLQHLRSYDIKNPQLQKLTMTEDRKLKRLGFVDVYASKLSSGAAYVEETYQRVKPLLPQPVKPLLAKVEETVFAYAAPVVTKASDQAEKFLRNTDQQVRPTLRRGV